MADRTQYFNLILPGFGEYDDSWSEPVNENFTAIDTALNDVTSEVVSARQSKSSLLSFLQVGHNTDGSLLPAPEVVKSRNSPIYGFKDGGGNVLPLKSRLDSLDYELFFARSGQAKLLDALAFIQTGLKDMVLSGFVNNVGEPAWLGSSGANARVDGSVTPLYLLIGGYVARVRTAKNIPISGAAGTYYLYATYLSGGGITVDGDSTVAPPAVPNGQTSQDTNNDMTVFVDATTNFSSSDVSPGDILTLLNSNDQGQYVVKTVGFGANVNKIQIIGAFPQGGLSGINYTVADPLAVTLGFSATAPVVPGRLYIGEADFDGVAVTAVRSRAFRDLYVGGWKQFNLASTATHEETWPHHLGSDVLDVEVQVSQANDGTQPVELLSVSDLTNNLAISITDGKTLNFSNNLNFNAGTSNATLTGTVTASLSGSVTGALTGTVTPQRSVAVKWDRNNISAKNVTANLLYKDYSGTLHQTGYVRVVVRKRG